MHRMWTIAAAGLALLAGCDKLPKGLGGSAPAPSAIETAPATTPPAPSTDPAMTTTGFSHVKGEDLFGYYFPTQDITAAGYRLQHIAIGPEDSFAAWESGQRSGPAAPIMLEFADPASKSGENELGQPIYAKTIRVLPTAYKIGGGDFRFSGEDPTLGKVQIDGTYDLEALKRLKAQGPSAPQDPVIRTGTQIGAAVFKNLSFFWFGGD